MIDIGGFLPILPMDVMRIILSLEDKLWDKMYRKGKILCVAIISLKITLTL